MSPAIRPFRPSDLPAMQALRHAAFTPVFASFRAIVGESIFALVLAQSDVEQAQLLDGLCRRVDDDHKMLVATIDETVVGFAAYSIDTGRRIGEIGLNAVDPAHAGSGIGTALYARALADMKDRGMAVATVGTGGDPSHAPARRAYEKAGFGPAIPSIHLYKLL